MAWLSMPHTTAARATAAEIEPLADAAWPAGEQVLLGPWKLRATNGVSARADSVLTTPMGHRGVEPGDVARLIGEAETFYRARRLAVAFQISPATEPADLDRLLRGRGYRRRNEGEVWTADAGTVEARTTGDVRTSTEARSSGDVDAGWLDCALENEPAARRAVDEAVIARIPRPRRFVSVSVEGRVVACGLAVAAGGFAGIYAVTTRAAHRGRGLATVVLHALAAWGHERGERLYLEVAAGNAVARHLYRRRGFTPAYRHHYCTLDG